MKVAKKCCPKCQDYKHCNDKDVCCEFCDHFFKGKCLYVEDMKRNVGKVTTEDLKFSNYIGDDYGIDDYKAYEGFEGE